VVSPRPLVVLSGFLGAGKTSLLARLGRAGGLDGTVVLVNEAGDVSIDGELLRAARAEVVDLAGGTACCLYEDEDDLADALVVLRERTDVRRVVLETSGLTHPAGLLNVLQQAQAQSLIQFRAFAVVVDVPRAPSYLRRFEEARAQVRTADRAIFSKIEAASAAEMEAAQAVLRELNPSLAPPVPSHLSDADLARWLWEPADKVWPASPAAHRHEEIFSISLVDYAPYDVARILAVLGRRLSTLLRVKGFVHVAGRAERAFVEWTGPRFEVSWGEPFGRHRPRTELVVIAAGSEEARSELDRSLRACREGKGAL